VQSECTQHRDRYKLSEHDDIQDTTASSRFVNALCLSDTRRGRLVNRGEGARLWRDRITG
jgi:hypothetical protein